MRAYYVPGTTLGTTDAKAQKAWSLWWRKLQTREREQVNRS